jgi:hypothetical protein
VVKSLISFLFFSRFKILEFVAQYKGAAENAATAVRKYGTGDAAVLKAPPRKGSSKEGTKKRPSTSTAGSSKKTKK